MIQVNPLQQKRPWATEHLLFLKPQREVDVWHVVTVEPVHPTQPAAQENVGTHCSSELQSDSTLQNSPSPPSESETVGLLLPPQLETHTVGPTPGIGGRVWLLGSLFTSKLVREKNNVKSSKKLFRV